MSSEKPLSREERLAQRLRENLHRRKAQARELAAGGGSATGEGESADGAVPLQGTPGLPKAPPAR